MRVPSKVQELYDNEERMTYLNAGMVADIAGIPVLYDNSIPELPEKPHPTPGIISTVMQEYSVGYWQARKAVLQAWGLRHNVKPSLYVYDEGALAYDEPCITTPPTDPIAFSLDKLMETIAPSELRKFAPHRILHVTFEAIREPTLIRKAIRMIDAFDEQMYAFTSLRAYTNSGPHQLYLPFWYTAAEDPLQELRRAM